MDYVENHERGADSPSAATALGDGTEAKGRDESRPGRQKCLRHIISIAALLSTLASAVEIIDRIAVIAGKQVITESEIFRELRTVALLNGQPVDLSLKAKRAAADRLVEQSFIRREIEASRYAAPSAADIEKLFAQTKQAHFPTDAAYQAALSKYGVSEEELKQHLQLQLITIRFIDFRFRPGVQVPSEDLTDYYEKIFVPEWKKKSSEPAPSLADSREQIEQILAEQRVDQAIDRWVNEQRTQTRIQFQEPVFR